MGYAESLRPGGIQKAVGRRGNAEDTFASDGHGQNVGLPSGRKGFCASTLVATSLSHRPVPVQIKLPQSDARTSFPSSGHERSSSHVNPAVANLLTESLHCSPDGSVVDHHQGNRPQQALLKGKVL
jgi:hypothetical protein